MSQEEKVAETEMEWKDMYMKVPKTTKLRPVWQEYDKYKVKQGIKATKDNTKCIGCGITMSINKSTLAKHANNCNELMMMRGENFRKYDDNGYIIDNKGKVDHA